MANLRKDFTKSLNQCLSHRSRCFNNAFYNLLYSKSKGSVQVLRQVEYLKYFKAIFARYCERNHQNKAWHYLRNLNILVCWKFDSWKCYVKILSYFKQTVTLHFDTSWAFLSNHYNINKQRLYQIFICTPTTGKMRWTKNVFMLLSTTIANMDVIIFGKVAALLLFS